MAYNHLREFAAPTIPVGPAGRAGLQLLSAAQPSAAIPFAASTDNKLAVGVLKGIADKERADVGEFLRLLRELAPDEVGFFTRGAKEAEAEIEKRPRWFLLGKTANWEDLLLNPEMNQRRSAF